MTTDRRSLLAAVGSVGAIGTVALGSRGRLRSSADGAAPRIEPIFSYPTPIGRPDDVHERTVRRLLDVAAPGASVHLATYTFTRVGLARAFVEAARRGVEVNVLIDGHLAEADAVGLLRSELGDRVAIVDDGAIGVANSHNKFLLVEELATGGSEVVWQSSANFTWTQLHRHNASVVFRGDGDLYRAYRDYWEDLAAGETDLDYNRTEETESATVHFSPRSDFDTHLAALADVVPSRDAAIRFVYSIWNAGRLDVVDRVGELVDGGCTVEVILDGRASAVGADLRRAGATVLEYPTVPPPGGTALGRAPNVHSKTMLVDAEVDAGGTARRRKLVYTGSQNLSESGLRANDDAFLRIESDDVYCRFLRDWRRVYEQGVRLSEGGVGAYAAGRRRNSAGNSPC